MSTRLDKIPESKPGRQLIAWMNQFKYFTPKNVHVFRDDSDIFDIAIYTSDYKYRIVAKKNYLGCTATTRRARPGEDWNRGSDLPDGDFSRDTLINILGAIVLYELKEIVERQTPRFAPGIEDVDLTTPMPGYSIKKGPG